SADTMPVIGEVICRGVRLRSGPELSAPLLHTLRTGETFLLLDRYDAWYHVSYQADTMHAPIDGWLLQDYVLENPTHIILRRSNTPAYASPWNLEKKVGSLPRYTRLTVMDETDDCWLVSLRGAAAFITKDTDVWMEEDLADLMQWDTRTATVTRRTTLRTGPGTHWERVETLAAGKTLEIIAPDGDWYAVRYDTTALAYVAASDVRF
ncbi:MAG: SH3 domain-containing protein, partial [Clostridia bacterium]